nr:DUF6566 family protein [Paraburkholderia sp. LEh10]
MIRQLTRNGRTFAYIPEPAPPIAPKPAPVAEAQKPRDELARGVFWKSPETWQSAAQESSVTSGWRALAPMADITRQLAGSAAVETGYVETGLETRAKAASPIVSGAAFGSLERVDAQIRAAAVCAEVEPRDDADAPAGQHTPLWMSLTAPRGLQVADRQGYAIYVAAEQVPDNKYRAWAEIMKDGKRVERSGLIGPRFADADAAHRFALDWARQWIDRACHVREAATGLHVSPIAGVHAPQVAVRPVTRAMPELTPTPALAASNAASALPGNPHLPQHLNPRLMPLRRYPSDVVKDKSGERYPLASHVISHAG